MEYQEFLETKKQKAISSGFEKPRESMNVNLFEWQKDTVYWALKKGRAALFEDCGLGKTIQQLEWAQSVCDFTGKPVIIVAPLAVAEQTRREGERFGYSVKNFAFKLTNLLFMLLLFCCPLFADCLIFIQHLLCDSIPGKS